MLDYNPILPDIQKVIQRHVHLLRSSPELLEIFPSKSIFPAYRRTKNLKDILAPSKFGRDGAINQAGMEMGGNVFWGFGRLYSNNYLNFYIALIVLRKARCEGFW